MNFRIVIWGLGTNGKNIIDVLGIDKIVAIIDSNEKLLEVGTYKGIPIIPFEQYLKKYRDYYIVVTPMKYTGIEEILKKEGIERYFIHANCNARNLLIKTVIDGNFIDIFSIDVSKHYKIMGVNIFSIYLYQHLRKENISVELVADNEVEERYLEELKEWCCIENSNKNKLETAYIDAGRQNCIQSVEPVLSCEKMNDLLYENWKTDIRKFKNSIKNKRIFIIATGPSIRLEDLELLDKNHELTMGMNGVYYLFSDTEWRPTYYVVSDGRAIREYDENCKRDAMPKTEKFLSDNYLDFWKESRDETYHCFRQEQQPYHLQFSEDCAECVYAGSTVVYACLQLASYMGAKELYLLGCDFSFSKDMTAGDNHCYKKKDVEYAFDFEHVTKAYEKAKEYADKHGIKIYNATRGGKLEIFERVDFDSLF